MAVARLTVIAKAIQIEPIRIERLARGDVIIRHMPELSVRITAALGAS